MSTLRSSDDDHRIAAAINGWVVKNELGWIGIIFLCRAAIAQYYGLEMTSGLFSVAAAILLVGQKLYSK